MGATAAKPLLAGIVLCMLPINVKSSRGFWIPYGALMTGGIGAFICWTDR